MKGQTRTKRNDAVTIMERTIENNRTGWNDERKKKKDIYSKRKTRERETNETMNRGQVLQ